MNVTDLLLKSSARVERSGPKICPVCCFKMPREEIHMIPRFSSLGRHKDLFYVDNVTMKCPRCNLLLQFGVPISKKEYEEELALRQKLGLGKSISASIEDELKHERLVLLGYLPGAAWGTKPSKPMKRGDDG